MLEHIHRRGQYYDFAQAGDKLAKLYTIAEAHFIDKNNTVQVRPFGR